MNTSSAKMQKEPMKLGDVTKFCGSVGSWPWSYPAKKEMVPLPPMEYLHNEILITHSRYVSGSNSYLIGFDMVGILLRH